MNWEDPTRVEDSIREKYALNKSSSYQRNMSSSNRRNMSSSNRHHGLGGGSSTTHGSGKGRSIVPKGGEKF